MTGAYFGAFQAGQVNAIARTIDFYGGVGAFAGWPRRIRDCTGPRPTHLLTTASLSKIAMPILVVRGENSHPAVQRANELVCQSIPGATIAAAPRRRALHDHDSRARTRRPHRQPFQPRPTLSLTA
jgi:hypothetical protein